MVKMQNMLKKYDGYKIIILILLYGLITVIGVIYRQVMIETDMAMLFLLLNILSASVLRPSYAYIMTLAGVIIFHYFLLPDYHSFRFQNAQHIITYAVMVFSGIFAINITQSQRKEIQKNKRLQYKHKKYYQLACHLSALRTSEQIAQATVQFLNKESALRGAVFLSSPDWRLVAQHDKWTLPDIDSWQPNQPLSAASVYWLKDRERELGALVIQTDQPPQRVEPWVLSLLSLSLARSQANQALAQVEAANQLESMRSTLLASVSHDLKTPLGTIIGAATTLADNGVVLSLAIRDELLQSIAEQGRRLNRSLTKLLDITRYTTGALVPKLDWVEPEELIGSVLATLNSRLTFHHIQFTSTPMLVELDSLLIEQVILNLLENAIKYTPRGSQITITTDYTNGRFILTVADNGPGVPEPELIRIFERFYRLNDQQKDGTGLGLAICQVIVLAHRGEISAHNLAGGGICFNVSIPCRLYDLKELYEQ